VVIAMCTVDGTASAGSGYASLGTLPAPGSVLEYKTGAGNATATCGGASNFYTAGVLSLRPAGNYPSIVRRQSGGMSVSGTSAQIAMTTSPGSTFLYLQSNVNALNQVTFSDSKGDTVHPLISGSCGIDGCYAAYAMNVPAGVTWVKATPASGDNFTFTYAEYAGISTTNALDQQSTRASSPSSPWSSPTVTTTQAHELLLGEVEFGETTDGGVLTPTGNWVKVAETDRDYSASESAIMEQMVLSTQTNIAATGTGSKFPIISAIYTFKAAQ
jgi:hypothetical protein